MHELSIAMSIVELAEEEAERRSVQVNAVHLKLGALSGVVKEALLVMKWPARTLRCKVLVSWWRRSPS